MDAVTLNLLLTGIVLTVMGIIVASWAHFSEHPPKIHKHKHS